MNRQDQDTGLSSRFGGHGFEIQQQPKPQQLQNQQQQTRQPELTPFVSWEGCPHPKGSDEESDWIEEQLSEALHKSNKAVEG